MMNPNRLTAAILACIPLLVSMSCSAAQDSKSSGKEKSASKPESVNKAVTTTPVKKAISTSDGQKIDAKKLAIQQAYKDLYAEQLQLEPSESCDNSARLGQAFEEELELDQEESPLFVYKSTPAVVTFMTPDIGRYIMADYSLKTKKADNYRLRVVTENCAMINNYHKNFATDKQGNKYKVERVGEPIQFAMTDDIGKPIASYHETFDVPLSKDILVKNKDKGMVITLHTDGSGNDKAPRRYFQDVYIEPAIIKLALDAKESMFAWPGLSDNYR